MRTHLRLHQATPTMGEVEGPSTYLFPTAMAEARRTLVAGVVNVPATPEPPVRMRFASRTGVLAHIHGGVDRTTETDRLLRQVETTLDDMQTKLDTLSGDVDGAFKFPVLPDDDRPRAA